MEYQLTQNEQLRTNARDEKMVTQEALVDMELACGYVPKLSRQLMINPTADKVKEVEVNVKNLRRFIRPELVRVKSPTAGGPLMIALSEGSVNQASNVGVQTGLDLDQAGPSRP